MSQPTSGFYRANRSRTGATVRSAPIYGRAGQILLANTAGSPRAWGRLVPIAGKGMLWIDNAYQTWWNVVRESAIPLAGVCLTIRGASGRDLLRRMVGHDGGGSHPHRNLHGRCSWLFELHGKSLGRRPCRQVHELFWLRASVHPLCQGRNLVALPLIPADPSPGVIFTSIAGQYSAVFVYNACDSVSPNATFDVRGLSSG